MSMPSFPAGQEPKVREVVAEADMEWPALTGLRAFFHNCVWCVGYCQGFQGCSRDSKTVCSEKGNL